MDTCLWPTEVNKLKGSMKLIKTLIVGMFALALMAAPAFAGCCDDAKKEGKECTHKCCVEAKKEGKACEKCSPKPKEGEKK